MKNRCAVLLVLFSLLAGACHREDPDPAAPEPDPTQPEPDPTQPEPSATAKWDLSEEGSFITHSVRFETQGVVYEGLGSWTKNGDTERSSPGMAKYDLTTQTFVSIAPYPSSNTANCIAFGLNGKAYAGGGWNPKGLYSLTEFYEYDPATGKWSARAPVPKLSRDWKAFTFNNRGFIFLDAQVWEYLPETNTWVERSGETPTTSIFDSFRIGSKEYLIGEHLYEYDHDTEMWSKKKALPIDPLFAFVVKEKIYVGTAGEFWTYDNSDIWKELTPCPSPDQSLRGYSFNDVGVVGTVEHNVDIKHNKYTFSVSE